VRSGAVWHLIVFGDAKNGLRTRRSRPCHALPNARKDTVQRLPYGFLPTPHGLCPSAAPPHPILNDFGQPIGGFRPTEIGNPNLVRNIVPAIHRTSPRQGRRPGLEMSNSFFCWVRIKPYPAVLPPLLTNLLRSRTVVPILRQKVLDYFRTLSRGLMTSFFLFRLPGESVYLASIGDKGVFSSRPRPQIYFRKPSPQRTTRFPLYHAGSTNVVKDSGRTFPRHGIRSKCETLRGLSKPSEAVSVDHSSSLSSGLPQPSALPRLRLGTVATAEGVLFSTPSLKIARAPHAPEAQCARRFRPYVNKGVLIARPSCAA